VEAAIVEVSVVIINKCEDCNHRNICRYRESYEEVIRNIAVNVPEPFTIALNCSHYYSTCTCLNMAYGTYNNAANSAYSTNSLNNI
jgi:hypothetical protein